MSISLRKIITFLIPLSIVFFSFILNAEAQSGNCQVTSAQFRTTRAINNVFFDDNNRPYVYIDLQSQNCVGETIEISITENDNIDTDVNGTNGQGDPCNSSYNGCMDNRVIEISSNQMTLSLIAGEDECEGVSGPDCDYFITTWDEVEQLNTWTGGLQLKYECNGFCDKNWTYEGILIDFGGTNTQDPDDPLNQGNNNNNNNNNNNGGVDVNPPNNSQNNPTIINLGLQNPLAGTINNVPELLQKIVYIIIKIGIPLVAMAILYAGFLFVTAQGRDSQIQTAKNALLFAVIGGLILLAAWLIADAIKDALMTIND